MEVTVGHKDKDRDCMKARNRLWMEWQTASDRGRSEEKNEYDIGVVLMHRGEVMRETNVSPSDLIGLCSDDLLSCLLSNYS